MLILETLSYLVKDRKNVGCDGRYAKYFLEFKNNWLRFQAVDTDWLRVRDGQSFVIAYDIEDELVFVLMGLLLPGVCTFAVVGDV